MEQYTYLHINLTGTYVVKPSRGFLHCITVNTSASGTVTVYDNTSAAGTVLAVLKSAITENSYFFDCTFENGLTVVTGAASDITVIYT